jgi:hypothetical protein
MRVHLLSKVPVAGNVGVVLKTVAIIPLNPCPAKFILKYEVYSTYLRKLKIFKK